MTKSQTKKLDKLFGEIIRSRGRCEWCNSNSYLNTAHIISRKFRQVRWDPENAMCLCASCHRKAHDNPLLFADWVFDRIGKEKYYELLKKSQENKKLFYEDILKSLEAK